MQLKFNGGMKAGAILLLGGLMFGGIFGVTIAFMGAVLFGEFECRSK